MRFHAGDCRAQALPRSDRRLVTCRQAPRTATASFHDPERKTHCRASDAIPSKISVKAPVVGHASSKMHSISDMNRRRNAGGCIRSKHVYRVRTITSSSDEALAS